MLAEIIAVAGFYHPRPGNVGANGLALIVAEQPCAALVCQDREQCFLVNQLGTKAVDHADRASAVGVQQRGKFPDDRQILVDQQTLVHDVDLKLTDAQNSTVKLQLVRRANQRRITLAFKELFEQLKLLLRRQSLQIHDRDLRNRVWRTAQKLFVRVEQNLEHGAPAIKRANVVSFTEFLHHRQPGKNLVRCIDVCDARGTFAIELDEAVRRAG